MLSAPHPWIDVSIAGLAVGSAAGGLGLTTLAPGVAPLAAAGLLATSLGATGAAFVRLAMRLRRIELENEGLIEEVSQEFDRVKDKLEIFGEALEAPRQITPTEVEAAPVRRVVVK